MCIFAGFAGGKPGTLQQLLPLMPQLKWVHALAAGVDNIVPILREFDGIDKIPVPLPPRRFLGREYLGH